MTVYSPSNFRDVSGNAMRNNRISAIMSEKAVETEDQEIARKVGGNLVKWGFLSIMFTNSFLSFFL